MARTSPPPCAPVAPATAMILRSAISMLLEVVKVDSARFPVGPACKDRNQ
jgi:hypothetical protein